MPASKVKPSKKKPTESQSDEASAQPDILQCDFCGKVFSRPSSIFAHMCERKRRAMDRDSKDVRLGMMAFARFMTTVMRAKEPPTWASFEASKVYGAFVRFGRFVGDINAVNPTALTDFLLKSGVPVDRWCDMPVYETYLREFTKIESADAAFERNLMLIDEWCHETGERREDFFRKVSPAKAVRWVVAGRISPWVMFTANTASCLFDRLSPEQVSIIDRAIDTELWARIFDQQKNAVEAIKQALDEVGL